MDVERGRDYVARYMAERYTPEELAQKIRDIHEFLESLPEAEEEQ